MRYNVNLFYKSAFPLVSDTGINVISSSYFRQCDYIYDKVREIAQLMISVNINLHVGKRCIIKLFKLPEGSWCDNAVCFYFHDHLRMLVTDDAPPWIIIGYSDKESENKKIGWSEYLNNSGPINILDFFKNDSEDYPHEKIVNSFEGPRGDMSCCWFEKKKNSWKLISDSMLIDIRKGQVRTCLDDEHYDLFST
jgi:hypothetical protein